MVRRMGSGRRKARHILTKSVRTRGKVPLSRYFASFTQGDKVLLAVEPSTHKGMYHTRYHSKVGEVKGMQGACYKVTIHDRKKPKELIVHPVHLRKV